MVNVKNNRNKEYEHGIKDVNIKLIGHDRSARTLDELDDTEGRPYHDQGADGIEHQDVAEPRYGQGLASWCRPQQNPAMKDSGDDNKRAEDDNLDEQTADGDAFPDVLLVFGICGRKKCAPCSKCKLL